MPRNQFMNNEGEEPEEIDIIEFTEEELTSTKHLDSFSKHAMQKRELQNYLDESFNPQPQKGTRLHQMLEQYLEDREREVD